MRIRAGNYLMKYLSTVHVNQDLCDQINTESIRNGLNLNFNDFTIQSLSHFINNFDRINNYIVGIFDNNLKIVGIYTIDALKLHGTAVLTAAILDQSSLGKNIFPKTIIALVDHFFMSEGIKKINARVSRDNWPMIFNMLYSMRMPHEMEQVFFYEGTLRQEYQRPDGTRMDVLCFAAYHPALDVPRVNLPNPVLS